MFSCKEKSIIKKYLSNIISNVFKENLVFAFITGSIVLCKSRKYKSDIDIVIVLRDDIDLTTFYKLKYKFIKYYLHLHNTFDFVPDTTWPSEYLTLSQLLASIKGRGLCKLLKEKERIEVIKWDYITEYIGWMMMLLISEFVIGDFKLYLALKRMVLRHFITLVQIYRKVEIAEMFPLETAKKYGEELVIYLSKMFSICNREHMHVHTYSCLYKNKDDLIRAICISGHIPKRVNFWLK